MIKKRFQRKLIGLVDKLVFSERIYLIRFYALIREFCNYLLCLPSLITIDSPNNKVNFIIYSQGRTGSTLLVDLLNSHPSIHCDREVFFLKTLFPYSLLKSKSLIYRNKHYGCKIQGGQLELQVGKHGVKAFIEKLSKTGWKFIYLRRKNLLKHAISKIIYRQIGTTNRHRYVKDQALRADAFRIDMDELLEMMKDIENRDKFDEEVLSEIPKLSLTYEDDLLRSEMHQDTMDRLFNYLNTTSCTVNTDLVRITGNNLRDFISNYDELELFIVKSPYAKYLERD